MISERISDDIPPQITNWNMVMPILMPFLKFTHHRLESGHGDIKTRYLPQKH